MTLRPIRVEFGGNDIPYGVFVCPCGSQFRKRQRKTDKKPKSCGKCPKQV